MESITKSKQMYLWIILGLIIIRLLKQVNIYSFYFK